MSDAITALLCTLTIPDMIDKCLELLATDLSAEGRGYVLLFLAFARKESADYHGAIEAVAEALPLTTDPIRMAMLHEFRAYSLYRLGRGFGIDDDLDAIDAANLPDTPKAAVIRGTAAIIRGGLFARNGRSEGLVFFAAAERLFAQGGDLPNVGWAQAEGADLAMRCGLAADARAWLDRMALDYDIPGRALLEARLSLLTGDMDSFVTRMQGYQGCVDADISPRYNAYAEYLRSVAADQRGDRHAALLHLAAAFDWADRETARHDFGLIADMTMLRRKLTGKEVGVDA